MKKQNILGILLSVLSLHAFCQIKDTTEPRKEFAIGFVFCPDNSFRTLSSDGSASANYTMKQRDSSEVAKFRFNVGLTGLFEPAKNFTVETGVLFSDMGYGTTGVKLYQVTGSAGTTVQYEGMAIWNYNYYYLDVPLNLGYAYQISRLKIKLNAGIILSYWLTSTSGYTLNNGFGNASINETMTPVLRHLNMFYDIGLGVSYDLSGNTVIYIEPTYAKSFVATVEGAPVSEYLYTIGVNIGMYFKF